MIKKLIVSFIILLLPTYANALPAFPGAQGWGSDTVGGRSASATLCKVNTRSNDTSCDDCTGNIRSGTFRYCASQNNVPGPKIIIFTVGGTIDLGTSDIVIRQPFTTIAGQTAPGGGILIRGPNYGPPSGGSASILIATHDVIVRGLRVRDTGDSGITALGDCGSYGCVYNVVVDHNSMSWNYDAMAEAWQDTTNVTYSYNILSESIPAGRQGFLIGGDQGCDRNNAYDISLHHNLFAHNSARNPLIKHDVGRNELINNVIYNWGYAGIETYSTSYIAKNVLIPGPNHTGESPRGIRVTAGGECPTLQSGEVMVTHNIGPDRPTDSGDDWLAVDGGTSSYRTNSPPFTLWGMTEDDVSTVKAKVLAEAGATVPSRDSVDVRVISEVNSLGGSWINDPSDVGGWPTIATTPGYPTDTDGDGMPDAWESLNGTDPDVIDFLGDIDGDGYLNIEEYVNSFFETATGDTDPPDVVNKSPAPDVTGWLVTDRDVSFDVTDATGVDSSTLTFNIDGASNKTCASGLTCTPSGDPTSLNVSFTRVTDWEWNTTYTINVAVDDIASPANSQATNWQFTTEPNPDQGPPTLESGSEVPTPNTTIAVTSTGVSFNLEDDVAIDADTVQMDVGAAIQICGAGLTCSWIGPPGTPEQKIHAEYTHASNWNYDTTYTVSIQADDTSANRMNDSWIFYTVPAPVVGPPSDIEIHIEDP